MLRRSASRPISKSSTALSPSFIAQTSSPGDFQSIAVAWSLVNRSSEAPFREVKMDGNEFVAKLKAENESILAKIDTPPLSSGICNGELLSTLMKMALKNEIEAAEIAAEWVSTTPELPAKLALACHAGDEARHYQLIEEKVRAMGVSLEAFRPLDPPSPVL